MASVAPAPRQEVRGGGAWNLLEKAACFIASAVKDRAAAAAQDENSETDALSRVMDALGYGTAAGEDLDCYTADGENNGSSQKRELRHQGWREDK